ncbi:putative reverse transcriptase domain-containing protein [Tanacetum coccineum]
MVLAPRQPIPHGRPYRYHLNGLVNMMTMRKRVGPLPTHHLVVRHSVDYSSSGYFSSDDSSSDSSSSSSSETSSDSPADALSDSASSRSSFDHSLSASLSGMRSSHRLCSLVPSVHRSSAIFDRPSHDSSSASHSRKRSRSPVASVPLSSPILGALSYARVDLLPSPKRIRSPETATDLEDCSEARFEPYVPREVGLGVDFKDESSEPYRDRGIDARVVVEAVDREESKTSMRGLVKVKVERVTHPVMLEDNPEPAHLVEVTYETLGDLVKRIVGAELVVTVLTERVAELERDNRRLRGTTSVEIAFSDDRSVRNLYFLYFETNVMKMPNTWSGASRTREAVNEQSDRWMAEALRVHDAVRNLRPLMGDEVKQEEVGGNRNGGNGDRGNGNGGNRDRGNGNGGNGNGGNGNGVVGLNRWFEKMEIVFHISKCPEKYQVKYASCTLLNSALTWWNSHKRMIGNEAAYAMSWAELMKLMTEELILLCTRMVPNEKDRVERFIGGLPDNIQGNVIAANPARFQDVVRIANQLMDKKLQGYAARSAESKRRMESNPRDNRGQQPPFKRQNISGQNVVKAYTTGNNERRGKDCSKLRNQNRGNQTRNRVGNKTGNHTGGNEATAKAYAIGGGGTNPDSNVVTDTSYVVKLADGRISETNVVLRGCTLGLLGHPFDIDIMHVELSSFDVIIDMDWLVKYHALIICDEKVIHIPYGDEVLIIRGDNYGNGSKLNIILCTRTQKYIQKGSQVYLAQVTSRKAEDKLEEKRLEDVPIIREFPEVFPDDLPRLPHARQVEFQINLVPGVAPVARTPYRLAPAKM